MKRDRLPLGDSHLLWVYGESAEESLDAATWLETTRELRKIGWHVTLVTRGTTYSQYIRGVEVSCIQVPSVYILSHVLFHIKTLRKIAENWTNIDVIYFHQISALWFLPLKIFRHLSGRNRPLIVMDTRSVHMEPFALKLWKAQLLAPIYALSKWLVNCWADGQTAITDRMAKTVRIPSRQFWGTWPSGVNLAQFSPVGSSRRWPSSREAIHLIYTGCLQYQRNLMALCLAVERANAEGMNFILSIVGEGSERLVLENFAARTEERIRVLPPVPHDQIPGLLTQAHVGVLPFPDEVKFQVSSPIKLFEFMAAGLPILATRITCITDVDKNSDWTFWAEKADSSGLFSALCLVWKNRDSLGDMGMQASIASQPWTWQESARKLNNALVKGMASS